MRRLSIHGSALEIKKSGESSLKLEEKIQEIDEKLDAIIKYLGISAKPQRNVIELRKEAGRIIEKMKETK